MNHLRNKTNGYREPEKVQKLGLYPYFRVIESDQDTEVIMNGKKVLMFGSNSYLGLTNHPEIKEAAKKAIDKYGTGCAGSRFLNGTLDIHLELEDKLARFVGKEAALVFSTGFQVNIGVIPAVTGRNDYVIIDSLDHASIIEATRLAFGKVYKFKHADPASLELILRRCDLERLKLIVVDGVFSMDGDIAPLPDIIRLAKKYQASVMVDDAHGIGVLGDKGAGTSAHFGVTKDIDLIMGTFSKSLAAVGGFIASDKNTVKYIKHHSRSLIFSASITPASAASVIAALDIIRREPERIEKLWQNTHHAIRRFRDAGFDIGQTATPIIPVYLRDVMKTLQMTRLLLEEGIFVNPVVPPAVSRDAALIRFSLMSTHSFNQIDQAIDKMTGMARKMGMLNK
ncbi:MAG: pyridoxal phosphate-dependent aminotransferase family protein [Bacteroidetes bacterium]|nr:pyridoxal phosphate-dependent aminotransferase family protein [Bacteroidota bacterium]